MNEQGEQMNEQEQPQKPRTQQQIDATTDAFRELIGRLPKENVEVIQEVLQNVTNPPFPVFSVMLKKLADERIDKENK